ncbi:GntR family transcriptional regulator [Actinotalea ferrariae]|uniref:GntR family transcriptional regulator n=1 Tax=Actinotalea ferrariae TaxID=1386098 RepID=UPI001C8C54FB|nr:GntR family transcriptional regulator [Actinotalea ferrariae]MBX9246220.1 GntR family transcriptional regulator [Actinotalea ferrariae]
MRAGDRVYAALREEIVAGRLRPGAELSEVEQAERWGVSRTPVREALSRLRADGLAVVGRGRTLTVSDIQPVDVVRLFELREALETQAARLAARRCRPEVFAALAEQLAAVVPPEPGDEADPHGDHYYGLVATLDAAVDDATDSPYLRSALAALRPHVARARRLASDNPARLRAAAAEHRLIAEAIADRDESLAVHATAVHLRLALANVLTSLEAAR